MESRKRCERKNLQKVCKWLKTDCNLLDTSRKDTVSYADYDMVIVATQSVETEIGVDLGFILGSLHCIYKRTVIDEPQCCNKQHPYYHI